MGSNKMQKEITVALYSYRLTNSEWNPGVDVDALEQFVEGLHAELNSIGVSVACIREPENIVEVSGYGDLLNIVRVRSPKDHIGNLCLGHVIGQSENCDLFEDIRRGVSRVAFAPEMIEPEGSNKIVCHNCGCGC